MADLSQKHPPTTLAGLKRYAKALKRQDGITHTQALDSIAQWMGYANFTDAHRALEGGAA